MQYRYVGLYCAAVGASYTGDAPPAQSAVSALTSETVQGVCPLVSLSGNWECDNGTWQHMSTTWDDDGGISHIHLCGFDLVLSVHTHQACEYPSCTPSFFTWAEEP